MIDSSYVILRFRPLKLFNIPASASFDIRWLLLLILNWWIYMWICFLFQLTWWFMSFLFAFNWFTMFNWIIQYSLMFLWGIAFTLIFIFIFTYNLLNPYNIINVLLATFELWNHFCITLNWKLHFLYLILFFKFRIFRLFYCWG